MDAYIQIDEDSMCLYWDELIEFTDFNPYETKDDIPPETEPDETYDIPF